MRGFWAGIWRSAGRSVVAGAILSALLASVLYAFNWHTFYDTQRNQAIEQAQNVASDLGDIAAAAGRAAQGEQLPGFLRNYLDRRPARIEVTLSRGGQEIWRVDNHADVDLSRTQLTEKFHVPAPGDGELAIVFREGIRPSFATALMRAWTFSFADYARDPDGWHAKHLYNRSLPLYGYLLTVVIVGFGTIRALHRDQRELTRLEDEGEQVAAELLALGERNRAETETLRQRVGQTESQRDEAVSARERMNEEIAAVEQEYDAVTRGEAPDRVSDERLRAIKKRKSQIERELANHDAIVDRFERDLGDTRAELTAAEDLLGEVEERHQDLESKLRSRNREIRKLKHLVADARIDATQIDRTTSQQASDNERRQSQAFAIDLHLEEQLEIWLDAPGEVNVSFSAHSRTGPIQSFFGRLDRDFVDRFFSHVTNPEYERGARRIIRVQAAPESTDEGGRYGEIVIALDDDAGRTLGLRFDLKTGAADTSHVGFVLALLLRARTRSLAHYPIRVR